MHSQYLFNQAFIMKKNLCSSLLRCVFAPCLLALLLCVSTQLQASSHREAPLISNDPLADNVDVYAFRSPDNPNTVTLIATYVPMQLPHGGPNYYSFGENIRYEVHIDNDASKPGDEIVFRFTFTKMNEDPTTFFNIRLGKQNLKTTYKLERSMDGGLTFTTIIANGVVPPPNIGARSIESGVGLGMSYGDLMASAITTASTGEKVFCGPTDDPFFVDLGGIFDLGDAPRQNSQSRDGLACYNVSAICIQVPISTLLKAGASAAPTSILDPNYVIGVWASASRRAIRTLSAAGQPTETGDWVQVSRLGMPLTNEAVIPVGQKDFWNRITPYDEITETTLDAYFFNPELALYMDDAQFGGAVPGFGPLRIQRNALQGFDFGNGRDGLFALKGTAAVAGTALDDAVFGTLLLPGPGKPRSVDLWPIFHTGVPNVRPYQLATGKMGNPLAEGKPFINNFLPNGGDMLRLNMAVPVTPRNDAAFSPLGIVAAAVAGLTNPAFNANKTLQAIPNMDGFPNGRRLEDDVTLIELQAVSGVALAAIGLWYDDYTAGSANPVTPNLVNVLSYRTGVDQNDIAFESTFPYLAMPWRGTSGCSGNTYSTQSADLELSITADKSSYKIYENVTYTITVKNNGPAASGKVVVDAGLPATMVYTNAVTTQGNYNLFFEEYTIPDLAAGESATLRLTLFTLEDDAPIKNFVQIKTAQSNDIDSTPGNDTNQIVDEDDEANVTLSPMAVVLRKDTDLETELRGQATGTVFPVPASNHVTYQIDSDVAGKYTVQIVNYSGAIVDTKTIQLEKGQNQFPLDISNYSIGTYAMKLVGKRKQTMLDMKLVVVR
jgi:uncharacterized repeat protein (TIGR01451 family)